MTNERETKTHIEEKIMTCDDAKKKEEGRNLPTYSRKKKHFCLILSSYTLHVFILFFKSVSMVKREEKVRLCIYPFIKECIFNFVICMFL